MTPLRIRLSGKARLVFGVRLGNQGYERAPALRRATMKECSYDR